MNCALAYRGASHASTAKAQALELVGSAHSSRVARGGWPSSTAARADRVAANLQIMECRVER